MLSSDSKYLGDGLYVQWLEDEQMFRLFTWNGYRAENVVYLELYVYEEFCRYANKILHPEAQSSEGD